MRLKPLFVTCSLLLALTACVDGSDSEDAAGSGATPSGAASASTSGDPSASAEAQALAEEVEPSPTPVLEMGQTLEVEAARLRGPKGWDSDDAPTDTIKILQSKEDMWAFISIAETEDELGITETDIRRKGRVAMDNHSSSPGVRLRKPGELGGVPAYHLSGKSDDFTWLEKFGVTHNGYSVSLQFELPTDYSPARRQRIVDSVLATFEWK
ncbi:hypothetical protein [Nocardioides solisilvae]|uniref:hypothetical protein n=1 Tax=Nocardioides solisilvae TaxID=1542435 RepID=UPI000D74DF90|nr:hypothetical protein [Nocardioides solisilvae]